ncbi:hypothetical protein [Mycobacterium spongiae]|uniref:Secreted protein n=1 Tax=Mycobacterium spongiae TaxID=886343 RepID=A0A975K2E4_9MYCO|nr:hypothetical protein [Mycobacterium spongiae]QUR69364.1 hypothetical protein F6B93_21875 [Mycobacterium spongiae]
MTQRRALLIALVAVVLLATGPATADPAQLPLHNQGFYVFNQQHRDNLSWWNRTWLPQLVPKGALIQVQLPGDPIRWIPYSEPDCLPSPGWYWAHISDPNRHHHVPAELLLQYDVENEERYRESANPNEFPGVIVPFEDRVLGSSTVTVFDYRLDTEDPDDYWAGRGLATICLRPDPIPEDVKVLGFPPETPPTFVLTLVVGVRQWSLGSPLQPTPLPQPPEVRPDPGGPLGPNDVPADEPG